MSGYVFICTCTLYLFQTPYLQVCLASRLQAYLERQSQLNMKKQKGRGKGRGRGRGRSKQKPIAEDDADEEEEDQEEEEEKPKKPKKNKKHAPAETQAEPKRRLRGKQQEDDGPGWTEDMWEEYAKWQWGGDWKEWEEETQWDCWDHQKSFDRYACFESQCALNQLKGTESKERKQQEPAQRIPRKRRPTSSSKQDDEQEHMASKSKQRENKKSEITESKEETSVKKRKLEVDTSSAPVFEVPRKVRDQANMIASFAKEACELGIKDPANLTQENKAALKKNLPVDLEETRYNSYYKRPGFGLHIKAA